MATIEPTTTVHRIGGASVENLVLKSSEVVLDHPGFSVLLGGTAREAADQIRRVFADPVQFARLHAQSVIVASSTVEELRRAGFDVISAPTTRFPNHGRVTHPAGAAGFTAENVARLQVILSFTSDTPGDANARRLTMAITTGQTVTFIDRSGRELARARVDRLEGDTLSGRLTPGNDYDVVREVFRQWIDSANDQLLTEVDRLDAEIAAFGLRVIGPDGFEAMVSDFQPGEDMFTLRLEPEVSRNGAPMSGSDTAGRIQTHDRA